MGVFLPFLTAGIALSAILPAHANEPRIYSDRGGMPRCLEDSEHTGVLLRWRESERYTRVIRVVSLTHDLAVHTRVDRLPCKDWVKLNAMIYSKAGTPIRHASEKLDGILLPKWVSRALTQVAMGGTEYRTEDTAQDYLDHHPIKAFNVDTNRDLTRRFGVAFASELYRLWLERDLRNRTFADDVGLYLTRAAGLSDQGLKEDFKNRVIIRVPGLFHETKSAKRFETFFTELEKLGIPIRTVQTHSMDSVSQNIEITRQVIEEALGAGTHVIVIAQSKGATEAIGALALLSKNLQTLKPGYGRVDAYVGLSGVYDGSFLIDWVNRLPQWWLSKPQLAQSLASDGLRVTHWDGFRDLRYKPMRKYQRVVEQLKLPQNTLYLDVIGILPGSGLSLDQDSDMPWIQEIIRKRITGFGANDGYVEYPGDTLPKAWAPEAYTVPLAASHALVDGAFEGMALKERKSVRKLAGALMLTLLSYLGR